MTGTDLDGPVTDSRTLDFLAWMRSQGMRADAEIYCATQSWTDATGLLSPQVTRLFAEYDVDHLKHITFVPGALAALKHLQNANIPVHLITARPRETENAIIEFLEKHVSPLTSYSFESHKEKGKRMQSCGARILIEDSIFEAQHALQDMPDAHVIIFPHPENSLVPRHPKCIYTAFQGLVSLDTTPSEWNRITTYAWQEIVEMCQEFVQKSA